MAKKPEFKLYRICNRENGKAFQGVGCGREAVYSNLGAFFRSPETIRRHLRDLCSEWKWIPREAGACMGSYRRMGDKVDEYKKFYVEVYSVLQLDMHTQEASDYLGVNLRAIA